MENRFWVRSMKKMARYVGFDLRLLPTIGLILVIISLFLIEGLIWKLAVGYAFLTQIMHQRLDAL